uniref:EcsC protein family protein n=1 Tax=Desulfacinum infernum TaxID=35837 RepID=A0A832EJJ7_9BACT
MTIQNDATNKDENKEVNALQSKLSENMMSVFDFVLSDRSEYFAKNPEKIPDKEDVQSIINSYSQKNAAISCSVGLVPGPLGMIATIPEIFTLIRNQIAMIYDVGMAYGKSKVLNKELISGILISSMGVGAGSLLIMHGNKILVKRVSLRVFQKIIGMLAGRITQQALKSSISKWLPGVGAAAMGNAVDLSISTDGKLHSTC